MSAQKKARTSRRSQIPALVAALLCVLAAGWLLMNRQYVVDQMTVWQYQPTQQVAKVAQEASLSDIGKFYFYASQPMIKDRKAFNSACERQEVNAAILGCYNGQQIFIFNVTDTRLDGIQAVTAAHEMLHAAYDRLSQSERDEVDRLVQSEYDNMASNPDLESRLEFYQRAEPGERLNELHAMIGTELADINPALEEHYGRYFKDRSQVVSKYESYSSVFRQLQERGERLAGQLTRLADSLNSRIEQYNKDSAELEAAFADFNRRAEGGEFGSRAAYESQRGQLLAELDRLQDERQATSSDLKKYQDLRQELLIIASESEALNRSIDSTLAPAPDVD